MMPANVGGGSIRTAIFTLCLALLESALLAQAGTTRDRPSPTPNRRSSATIVGSIHLPTGMPHPPRMMTVTLQTLGGSFLQRVNLSGDLSFSFTNVRNGEYVIVLESLGFETVEKTVEVTTFMSGEQVFVTLTLGKPLPDKSSQLPPRSGSTVSTQELAISEKARKELDKAREASEKNDAPQAIKHLQEAIRLQPNLYVAYNNLAVEYLRLNRHQDALQALEKSIALNPQDPRTYRNLAQLHLGRQAYPEAIQAVQRALELEPDSSRSHLLLAEAYLRLGQFQLALNNYLAAAADSSLPRPHLAIAQCHLQLGQHTQALQEFKAFLETEPQGPYSSQIRQLVQDLERKTSP